MPSKRLIPLAAMEELIRTAVGEKQRVSESAKSALKEILETHGRKLARDAKDYAQHAGRKTIKASDIKLAAKQ